MNPLLALAALWAIATPAFAQSASVPSAGVPADVEAPATTPVRVVEYLSFTCSHCAEQEAAVGPRLDELAEQGAIALEVRHALRDPIDLGVATLSLCQGPAAAPGNRLALFAAQADWKAKAETLITARGAELAKMEPVDAILTVLDGAGVVPLLRARGLTDDAARACLDDKGARDALLAQATEAWRTRQIPGTPYTLVDDQPVDGHDWATLEPAIQAAARQR